jgi:hypothetical protein
MPASINEVRAKLDQVNQAIVTLELLRVMQALSRSQLRSFTCVASKTTVAKKQQKKHVASMPPRKGVVCSPGPGRVATPAEQRNQLLITTA